MAENRGEQRGENRAEGRNEPRGEGRNRREGGRRDAAAPVDSAGNALPLTGAEQGNTPEAVEGQQRREIETGNCLEVEPSS